MIACDVSPVAMFIQALPYNTGTSLGTKGHPSLRAWISVRTSKCYHLQEDQGLKYKEWLVDSQIKPGRSQRSWMLTHNFANQSPENMYSTCNGRVAPDCFAPMSCRQRRIIQYLVVNKMTQHLFGGISWNMVLNQVFYLL